MIITNLNNQAYKLMKAWLYRKGYTKTEDIPYKRFVSLASSITHMECTAHNAKEYLYTWILKNSRLKESERANRIRESTTKKTRKIPERNGYNERSNNKWSGRVSKDITKAEIRKVLSKQ